MSHFLYANCKIASTPVWLKGPTSMLTMYQCISGVVRFVIGSRGGQCYTAWNYLRLAVAWWCPNTANIFACCLTCVKYKLFSSLFSLHLAHSILVPSTKGSSSAASLILIVVNKQTQKVYATNSGIKSTSQWFYTRREDLYERKTVFVCRKYDLHL